VDKQQAAKDKALALLSTHHITFDPNSAEAKRVLRKIDMRIMPMVFTVYLLQLMVNTCPEHEILHILGLILIVYRIKTACHLLPSWGLRQTPILLQANTPGLDL